MKVKRTTLLLSLLVIVLTSCTEVGSKIEEVPQEQVVLPANNFATLYQTAIATNNLHDQGAYLVGAAASCGYCHGDGTPNGKLKGGREIRTVNGRATVPALQGSKTLSTWNNEQLSEAIRLGKRPNGDNIESPVHAGYRWISDADLRAIVAYLRPLVPKRELQPMEDLQPRGLFTKSFEGPEDSFNGYVPNIPRSTSVQYGRYLAMHVAQCQLCHSPELQAVSDEEAFLGAKAKPTGIMKKLRSIVPTTSAFRPDSNSKEKGEFLFPGIGPNIRAGSESKLKAWSEQDIVTYLSTGKTHEDKQVSGNDCPWPFYQLLTPEDKSAIARYLKTL